MDDALIPGLFLSQECSDISIIVRTSCGHEMTVPGHSIIFKKASKVFDAMLTSGNFKEGQTGVVELNLKGDMDDAFIFLRCVYTKQLQEMDQSIYISLIQNAHLYGVDTIVKLCERISEKKLTPLSVCKVYNAVEKFASKKLLDQCLNIMIGSAFLIFWKNLHLCISEDAMKALLSSDKLNVVEEVHVLAALWRWGYTRCVLKGTTAEVDVKKEINGLLPLVRWQFIERIQETDPWFGLPEDEVDMEAKQREPDNCPLAFAKYADTLVFNNHNSLCTETLKIGCNSTVAVDLLVFSVVRDILLSGFMLQIVSVAPLNTTAFSVSVNGNVIPNLVSSEMLLPAAEYQKHVSDKFPFSCINCGRILSQTFNNYRVRYKIATPILLTQSYSYKMSLSVQSSSEICLPAISLTNSEGTFGSDRSVRFHLLREKVYGVCEMYYLV